MENEVRIGNQVWMKGNLDVVTFQNGDAIYQAVSKEDWINCGQNGIPAWCHYNNNEMNDKLYNWHAVNDERKLTPTGWRITTVYDWQILEKFINQVDDIFDIKLWASQGFRGVLGNFYGEGRLKQWWTNSIINEDLLYVSIEDDELVERTSVVAVGRCVRCVKEVCE